MCNNKICNNEIKLSYYNTYILHLFTYTYIAFSRTTTVPKQSIVHIYDDMA